MNKFFFPPNHSDDLCLLFFLYPSSMAMGDGYWIWSKQQSFNYILKVAVFLLVYNTISVNLLALYRKGGCFGAGAEPFGGSRSRAFWRELEPTSKKSTRLCNTFVRFDKVLKVFTIFQHILGSIYSKYFTTFYTDRRPSCEGKVWIFWYFNNICVLV